MSIFTDVADELLAARIHIADLERQFAEAQTKIDALMSAQKRESASTAPIPGPFSPTLIPGMAENEAVKSRPNWQAVKIAELEHQLAIYKDEHANCCQINLELERQLAEAHALIERYRITESNARECEVGERAAHERTKDTFAIVCAEREKAEAELAAAQTRIDALEFAQAGYINQINQLSQRSVSVNYVSEEIDWQAERAAREKAEAELREANKKIIGLEASDRSTYLLWQDRQKERDEAWEEIHELKEDLEFERTERGKCEAELAQVKVTLQTANEIRPKPLKFYNALCLYCEEPYYLGEDETPSQFRKRVIQHTIECAKNPYALTKAKLDIRERECEELHHSLEAAELDYEHEKAELAAVRAEFAAAKVHHLKLEVTHSPAEVEILKADNAELIRAMEPLNLIRILKSYRSDNFQYDDDQGGMRLVDLFTPDGKEEIESLADCLADELIPDIKSHPGKMLLERMEKIEALVERAIRILKERDHTTEGAWCGCPGCVWVKDACAVLESRRKS